VNGCITHLIKAAERTNAFVDLIREYIPADDKQRSYVVIAVDGAGIESAASRMVVIASDRSGPAVSGVEFSVR
jgi:hypothetical protein